MRDNITKVVERQERLDSLQDKTGRCFFQYSFTLAARIWPPACNHIRNADAHAFSRQSCRFRSRLQAQRESGPEGMIGVLFYSVVCSS